MWSTDSNAKSEDEIKWDARIKPEINWRTKRSPKNLPKFHQFEILIGVGREKIKPEKIFKRECLLKSIFHFLKKIIYDQKRI